MGKQLLSRGWMRQEASLRCVGWIERIQSSPIPWLPTAKQFGPPVQGDIKKKWSLLETPQFGVLRISTNAPHHTVNKKTNFVSQLGHAIISKINIRDSCQTTARSLVDVLAELAYGMHCLGGT